VATAAVIAERTPSQRLQECLGFLRRIDNEVPKELDLYVIVNNSCTHNHAEVMARHEITDRLKRAGVR
jgi:hypothetical protein